LDYIHWNPVKHGYVKNPMDWPYSTIHRFVAQGIYPSDWGGSGADEICSDNFGE
jgi:putative transposase